MNRCILVGRLTRDPELKTTQSNISVVSFTVAVNRQYTDESGERQADFIQCVVWRKQAENLAQYCSKGSLIGIDGRLQTRQYETDDGARYITEVLCDSIQFLESKQNDHSDEIENQNKKSYEHLDKSKKQLQQENDKRMEEAYEVSKKLAAEEDLPF